MVEETNKLFVGNLPYTVNDAELREIFESAGYQILDLEERPGAKVITDRETGRSRGFGFITLVSQEEAEKAAEEFNGKKAIGERTLVVNIARPMDKSRGSDRNFRR